jgi:ribose transport system ATP-binding protein
VSATHETGQTYAGPPPAVAGSYGASQAAGKEGVVAFLGVEKHYGSTHALAGVDLTLERAEILGLVGHNGAGKSTLMRVLAGLTKADAGTVLVGEQPVPRTYGPAAAHRLGIRIAFQELSLCPTLRVYENTLVAHPALGGWGWRSRCMRLTAEQLDRIFPGHGISVTRVIDQLPLARRQMVEIAQALVPDGNPVRVLVLDEPTSALGTKPAEQLFQFLRTLQKDEGISSIVISHRMPEILGNTDRIAVMRDGQVVSVCPAQSMTSEDIFGLMGKVAPGAKSESATGIKPTKSLNTPVVVATNDLTAGMLRNVTAEVRPGEIVGLAGLDGQGQHELLLEIWRRARQMIASRTVQLHAKIGYVTGDRQTAGLFSLWTVAQNISVNSLRSTTRFGLILGALERDLVGQWARRLDIQGSTSRNVRELSGGNQQRALLARALSSEARVILLDDPFRGVDVVTKQQVYARMRDETATGRSFMWFATENIELLQCDRVYVFRSGSITAELKGADLTLDRIIAASFAEAMNTADPGVEV